MVLQEWERELLNATVDVVPVAVVDMVAVEDVRVGMRIHNGYDPYMVVTAPVRVVAGGLVEVTFTVDGRTYRGKWETGTRMPVVAPLVFRLG